MGQQGATAGVGGQGEKGVMVRGVSGLWKKHKNARNAKC